MATKLPQNKQQRSADHIFCTKQLLLVLPTAMWAYFYFFIMHFFFFYIINIYIFHKASFTNMYYWVDKC